MRISAMGKIYGYAYWQSFQWLGIFISWSPRYSFNSKAGWQKWLTDNNVRIVDEYGGEVDTENLFECIELYYSPNGKNKQHLDQCISSGNTSEIYYCYDDDDGYPISMNKFS
jgi:hypothetical protein